jgi:CBS domain-containing protein
MLTEGDLLRRAELGTESRRPRWLDILVSPGKLADEYVHSHSRAVSDLMTADVYFVTEETPVADVVSLMTQHRIKRIPVIDGSKVVGIISRFDLLRTLAQRLEGRTNAPVVGDAQIRQAVLDELRRQGWAPIALVDVQVKDGEVNLFGSLMDERERAAIRVAAENVPGVRAVHDHLVFVEPLSGMVIAPPETEASRANGPAA